MPNPALLICFPGPMRSKSCWHQACLLARDSTRDLAPRLLTSGPPRGVSQQGAGAIDASPSLAGGMKLAFLGQRVRVLLLLDVENTLGVDLAVGTVRRRSGCRSAGTRAIAAAARPHAPPPYRSRFPCMGVVGGTQVYDNCLGKRQVQFVPDHLGIPFSALRVGALAPDMRMRLVTGSRQAPDQ